MSNFTMEDLNGVMEYLEKVDQPLIDSIIKFFYDNKVSIDTHILIIPNEFKSLITVPYKLQKSVRFSPYIPELIFIRTKDTKPSKFEFKTRYSIRNPLSVVNYKGTIGHE